MSGRSRLTRLTFKRLSCIIITIYVCAWYICVGTCVEVRGLLNGFWGLNRGLLLARRIFTNWSPLPPQPPTHPHAHPIPRPPPSLPQAYPTQSHPHPYPIPTPTSSPPPSMWIFILHRKQQLLSLFTPFNSLKNGIGISFLAGLICCYCFFPSRADLLLLFWFLSVHLFETGSHSTAVADWKHMILSPRRWNYRHVPPPLLCISLLF